MPRNPTAGVRHPPPGLLVRSRVRGREEPRMGTRQAAAIALLALAACRGQEATLTARGSPTPPDDVTAVPAQVETQAPASVIAGVAFDVACELRDAAGKPLDPGTARPELRLVPESSVHADGLRLTAVRAGRFSVACTYPALGLVDFTPAPVDVHPGAAAFVTTILDRERVTAGEDVVARCEA